jgi:hypothetical protein
VAVSKLEGSRKQHATWALEIVLDPYKKSHSLPAVQQPMIITQAHTRRRQDNVHVEGNDGHRRNEEISRLFDNFERGMYFGGRLRGNDLHHDGSDNNLAIPDDWALSDRVHAENGGLGKIDTTISRKSRFFDDHSHWGTEQRAEHASIGDRERST